jgi:hypothetical protein
MTEVKSSGGSTAHNFSLLSSIVYGAAVGAPCGGFMLKLVQFMQNIPTKYKPIDYNN